MLRRQCTREFKITPIEKRIRQLVGKEKKASLLLGISLDEIQRMKDNHVKWIKNEWPLIDARMNREDCKRLLAEHGMDVPRKSSCYYCPFHSDYYWLDLKKNHPTEWAKAVDADQRIRNMGMKVKETMYVHRSCKPLPEVDLKENQMDMFINECEGHCGV